MRNTITFILALQVFAKTVSCYNLSKEDESKVLKVLLKDALLKHFLALQLKRSLKDEVTSDFNSLYEDSTAVMLDTKTVNENNILVMTLALSLEEFLGMEKDFLTDFGKHLQKVKCQIADASEAIVSKVVVDLYCFYTYSLSSKPHPIIFVPVHKLERLLTIGSMRGFLQKYNVTSFNRKEFQGEIDDINKQDNGPTNSMIHKLWFPISIGVGSFFLVLFIITIYCVCCNKKKIKEGELQDDIQNSPSLPVPPLKRFSRHGSLGISPIKKRNSFSKSPRKFAYSPQKNSTPIFSFTSPSKYKDKVVYNVKSPIETTTPALVQPQLELLFPMNNNTASIQRTSSVRSSKSSIGSSLERSSKTLLQSRKKCYLKTLASKVRRGSSASLVIDLSPRSPVKEFTPLSDSPTEEILLRKSNRLRYKQLQKALANDKELCEEYWTIPPNTVSRKDSNLRFSLKNRYPDILPNSKTIVRLKAEDESHLYVNANYIRGYNGVPNSYIATQGPLACTVEDFWLMIWQCNCSIIVMITKLKERNKDKCIQYWPSSETVTQETYGKFTVTFDSMIERNGYRVITLYISHKNFAESRKVTHFWFTGWPDHKVPKECSQVLSLVKHVRQLQLTQSAPVVIHCSAGRGRTGCFIAISLGMFEIDEENKIDILKIVSRMRMDRGGMVDKDHQYKFIHKALYEYWSNKRRPTIISPAMKRRPASTSSSVDSSSPTSSQQSVEVGEELRESDESIPYDEALDESLNESLQYDEPVVKKIQSFSFNVE